MLVNYIIKGYKTFIYPLIYKKFHKSINNSIIHITIINPSESSATVPVKP